MASPNFLELVELLAYYERAAETVMVQIRALGRGQDDRGPRRSLARAVRATAADNVRHLRTTHAGMDRRVGTKRRGVAAAVIARRETTAAALALFDRHTPRRPRDFPRAVPGLGSYVRRGYLKHTAAGYVRTDKPFHVHRAPE